MGLEYARQMAAKGNDIIAVSNQEQQLKEVSESLSGEYGVSVIPHYQDLADRDSAQSLLDWCEAEGYEVENLICNAGMFFFEELGPDNLGKVDLMMNLHMYTTTKMCILFGDQMKKRGHGHILIMSSMAAKLPAPGIAVYASTKAYLRNFGKSLHFEMKPYGVGVTTVCPAAIATPLYNLKPSLLKLGVNIGVIWTAGRLVRRALRAMKHNRNCICPGFMNIYLPPMLRLLPSFAESKAWKICKKHM